MHVDPGLQRVSKAVPARAGIGLRSAHHAEFLLQQPAVGWVEVHSENYFAAGGPHVRALCRVREHYPVSLHGVGLSLGSADSLSAVHLRQLRELVDRVEPVLVSEHLSWGSIDQIWFNDLLPMPYTEEALDHMTARTEQVQDALGRQVLIENVSSYLEFQSSVIPEWEFLAELSRRSGCGLLLDVNNIYVSSRNHGFDPEAYLRGIPAGSVHEIHLAGHTVDRIGDREILIDTHNAPVSEPVWALYAQARAKFRTAPVLIEWDADLPPLETLVAEAHRAERFATERPDARTA